MEGEEDVMRAVKRTVKRTKEQDNGDQDQDTRTSTEMPGTPSIRAPASAEQLTGSPGLTLGKTVVSSHMLL